MNASKLKSAAGFAWAGLCMVIVLATFAGNDFFSRQLAKAPFMRINPRFSGGEVVKSIDHGTYTTRIHRPVFDALIGESSSGFVQIKWEPLDGIPDVINEEIDYDGDGDADFRVRVDTRTGVGALEALSSSVVSLALTCKLENEWVVRINLERPTARSI